MRILILRGGALGDFIVTLPLLGLLRARWPAARIELVGNVAAAQLAVGPGRHYLDVVHAQDDARWARLGSGTPLTSDDPLAGWLREFNLVLNFWPDADGAIAADLARLGFVSPPPDPPRLMRHEPIHHDDFRWILTHPPHPAAAPAAAHFCAALAPLGLATRDFAASLHLTAADHAAAAALVPRAANETIVAWHPGSGSPRKSWPAERWLEVIRRLRPTRVLVLLGPADSAVEARHTGAWPPHTTLLSHLAAPVLAAVLQRCALFLGHDTGPAHVAAAAGCPCVLVFGPTDPAVWAPPCPHVTVLRRNENTQAATVPEVVSAAAAALRLSHQPP